MLLAVLQLALAVLGYLEPKDLLRAAQTCHYWHVLCEDNILWREKCQEEGITEELVFGPSRTPRRRPATSAHISRHKTLFLRQSQIEHNWRKGVSRSPKVSVRCGGDGRERVGVCAPATEICFLKEDEAAEELVLDEVV